MASAAITEKDIRLFLMDVPQLNPLLQGVRWTAEDIDNAIVNVLDYYNSTAPFTGRSYSVETFPYRYLLLIGTAGMLLRSASINEASNQFEYSVDGVQVQDKNKAQLFAQMGQQYWEEFKDQAKQLKLNQAASQLFSTIGSEYGYW